MTLGNESTHILQLEMHRSELDKISKFEETGYNAERQPSARNRARLKSVCKNGVD